MKYDDGDDHDDRDHDHDGESDDIDYGNVKYDDDDEDSDDGDDDATKKSMTNNDDDDNRISMNDILLFHPIRSRPLTQEEIAERRQRAREKHAEMLQNANQNNTHEESIEHTPIQVEEEKDETPKTHFVAFARVYSGTIKKGQSLYVLGPRHDPSLIAEKKELISDKDNTDNK